MTWIDPAGSSLLGPSSEWLWTALSTLAVIVSLLAIYRELRLQTSVKETQQLYDLDAEWESERMARQRLALYLGIRDGVPVGETNASWKIAGFWERVGSLARDGHMSRRQLSETVGIDIAFSWFLLHDFIEQARAERDVPTAFEHFEWLAADMHRSRHSFGFVERPLTPARLDTLIADERTAIALEVSLRTDAAA